MGGPGMGIKSLQDILSTIFEQKPEVKLNEKSAPSAATPRRIVARTLEDRILYSVTPMMVEEVAVEAEAPQVSEEALDASLMGATDGGDGL
jgi:hypothetical protein